VPHAPRKIDSREILTRRQQAELKALAALPDSAIDSSDAPALLDWSGGSSIDPSSSKLTLPLDADIVAWFKGHTSGNEGYQTRIARVRTRAGKPRPAIWSLRSRLDDPATPR
jgi:uncharacterized protein (DUF4415 family)